MSPLRLFKTICACLFFAPFISLGQDIPKLLADLDELEKGKRKAQLQKIGEAYLQKKDSTSISYFKQALSEAQNFEAEDSVLDACNDLLQANLEFFFFDGCLKAIKKVEPLLGKCKDRRIKGEFYLLKGKTYKFLAKYRKAEKAFENSILDLKASGNLREVADAKSELGDNHRYQGNIATSTDLQFEALRLFENLRDSQGIADTRLDLAILNYYEGSYANGTSESNWCADWFFRNGDSSQLGFAYSVKALMLYKERKPEESEKAALRSIAIREAIQDMRGLGESYNNLSLVYSSYNDWKSARIYMEKSLDFLRRGNDFRQISVILNNLARVARKEGNTQLSQEFAEEALEEAKKSNQKTSIMVSYQMLSENAEARNDYKSALGYSKKYMQFRDSVFSDQKAKAIEKLKIEYNTEQKEKDNQLLQSKLDLQNSIYIGVVILLALLVVIGILIIRMQNLKRKKAGELYQREKTILETREALTQAELLNTRNQLDFNEKQLVDYMDRILRKNELIEELKRQIANTGTDEELEKSLPSKNLSAIIETKTLSPEDWNTFHGLFDSAYEGLLPRLESQYPNITPIEKQLFMLIKLNLNSQEAATVLGVSPDSIKKSRSNLRKKLQLEESTRLKEFLQNFS